MSDSAQSATPASRRSFIRHGAMAAVALPGVVSTLGCRDGKASATPVTAAKPATPPLPTPRQKADRMDAMHEKGVRAFPAKTEGKGNQLLELRMERGVKVYDLTAEELQWEVEPGRKVKAWAYNGQVPGPQIRVRQGDRVHAATQVGLGLLGAFIVEPRRPRPAHKADVDHVMVLNDGSPNPGTWAFHCHILPHAESEHGMFGMVTALVVQPAAA